MNQFTLHHGDCLAVLKTLPDNSVDAVVTDPPYGLSFMGKRWDYDVPGVDVWAECLRVLKPGGHLLAFAGTRTQHRMAVRIEDAGFEIRDMIAWVYGSGFPKSMDVSKAIDKAGGDALAWRAFSKAYADAVETSDLTHSDIDRALGIKSSSCYWARTDHRGGMPPRHHWEKVRDLLELSVDFTRLYDEAEREVLATEVRYNQPSGIVSAGRDERTLTERKITAPATDAARQWQGWGTALKPALEPITVARKPLQAGTVAANVLEYGTGALNIDGCRVATSQDDCIHAKNPSTRGGFGHAGASVYGDSAGAPTYDPSAGRWPANLIHDGSDEVLACFPGSKGSGPARTLKRGERNGEGWGMADQAGDLRDAGTGSAARFFYCPKASRADRNEGLPSSDKAAVANQATMREREDANWSARNGNYHPTVKPTDLMAYLCRLVTPPGGVVLDPFMGSGSTGKAAIREGFRFVGIEREAEYLGIARARIDHEAQRLAGTPQRDLFAA